MQGKAAGNFGCSVFGKMQPLPLTAVSTPIPEGQLFRADCSSKQQWMLPTAALDAVEQRKCYEDRSAL